MENKLYNQIRLYLGLFLFIISSGCIKDDLSDCPTSTYRLVVQTDARDQVKPEDIKDIALFLFDEQNRYVDYKIVNLNKVVELSYPTYNNLKAVAWANTGNENQTISQAGQGLTLDKGVVRLIDLPETGISASPDDLFHGIKDLDLKKETQNQPEVLTIKRKVSAIIIIARNLKEYAESSLITNIAEDYHYKVRESRNTLDFFGNLTGEYKTYRPDSHFNQKGEFIAPFFYVFPTESGKYVEVDIYRGNTPVYTINTNEAGQPIRAEEGKVLELIVDFSGNVSVTVSIEDWDKINVSEEF